MRSRRTVLSTVCAALAAVAGCNADSTDASTTQTTRTDPPPETTTRTTTTTTAVDEDCASEWQANSEWTVEREDLGRPVAGTDHVFVPADDAVLALDPDSGDVAARFPADGGIYAATDGVLVVDAGDAVRGFDVASGDERWSFEAPGSRGLTSRSAGVHDGTVYVGATQHPTPETDPAFEYGRLYGFDLRTGDRTLELDLTREGERWVTPEYVVADDTGVYVTLEGGGLVAVEDETTRWRRDGDDWYYPARRAGDVVVQPRSNSVVALAIDTGETTWTDETVEQAVAVADGVVYGTGGGSPQTYGTLAALDAASGDATWTTELDGCGGDVAVTDGVVATTVHCRKPRIDVHDAATGCRYGRLAADDQATLTAGDGVLYATRHPTPDELAAVPLP